MPSVLWRCWLGGRKGIWPVKKLSGVVLAWLSVWSEVQMICIWSRWCHCHPIISCSSKIQNGLPFWCLFIRVVLEKRPLNGYSVVSVKLWMHDSLQRLNLSIDSGDRPVLNILSLAHEGLTIFIAVLLLTENRQQQQEASCLWQRLKVT